MGLIGMKVSAERVASRGSLRFDVRFHLLQDQIAPFLDAISHSAPLGRLLDGIGNGVNIPAVAYCDEVVDASALYVSVGAVSQFALRTEAATGLAANSDGIVRGTRINLNEVSVRKRELWITRSGTPGIATVPGLYEGDLRLIPSGFMIRAQVAEPYDEIYLACVLNHPVWRLLTTALSAGKRQDNLSQPSLSIVPIPILSPPARQSVVDAYRTSLEELEHVIASDGGFRDRCDDVLFKEAGLAKEGVEAGPLAMRSVPLLEVATTRVLRIDNRWHGVENHALQTLLGHRQCVPLGHLIEGGIRKGRQPKAIDDFEDDGEAPVALTTAAIQSGGVAWEQVRGTDSESVGRFPVLKGDLLVAMDGDGSLGKAAVFDAHRDATTDSHLARITTKDPELAISLACYLNSSWGHVQTNALMSGSTGQTQLSPSDLAGVLVPIQVVEAAPAVADAYSSLLGLWEEPARRNRRVMCAASATLTTCLVSDGLIAPDAIEPTWMQAEGLLSLLDTVYPHSVR
jgi:hypothetical protein